MPRMGIDYVIALDFEATCDEPHGPEPQEIIEFPMVVIDWNKGEVVETFHRYVKPVYHPQLSDFCKKLTGITQEQVDGAAEFKDVFQEATKFLDKYEFKRVMFVTYGNWDLDTMLTKQCRTSGLSLGMFETQNFVNVNKFVREHLMKSEDRVYIPNVMEYLGIPFEGKLHSGIDDTNNIAKIMLKLREKYDFFYPEGQPGAFFGEENGTQIGLRSLKTCDCRNKDKCVH